MLKPGKQQSRGDIRKELVPTRPIHEVWGRTGDVLRSGSALSETRQSLGVKVVENLDHSAS